MRAFNMDRKTQPRCFFWRWSSPVGEILLSADARGLGGLNFQNGPHPIEPDPAWEERRSPFKEVIQQLEGYFAGKLRTFHVELSLQGTDFQLSVWRALRDIPYGATASYRKHCSQSWQSQGFSGCRGSQWAKSESQLSCPVIELLERMDIWWDMVEDYLLKQLSLI
jgi:hypothetical protein